MKLLNLPHQFFIYMEASRSIDDYHIRMNFAGMRYGIAIAGANTAGFDSAP